METLVLSLYGGPGCGKSTTAAGLFNKFKTETDYKVELVTEYAKDVVYSGNKAALADQFYLTAKQAHRLNRLDGKVDLIIQDAGLLNAWVYERYYEGNALERAKIACDAAFKLDLTYSNVRFFLNRTKPYAEYGRTQSEDEAKLLDVAFSSLKKYLDGLGHEFGYYVESNSDNRINEIFYVLENELFWLKK